MGTSHALAYHTNPNYKIQVLVNRSPPKNLPVQLQAYPQSTDFYSALQSHPTIDIVSINTHTATHAEYAIASLNAGAHVFVEKPLATTVSDAERVVETARRMNRKLVVGYILRHHPSWKEFIARARSLGPPFVMRMNLNQRSEGSAWDIHKRILGDVRNPVVDCGVHYLDVMVQITGCRAVQVRGMGVSLSEELGDGEVNYGHLQVIFEDGSVGWYEAGWGPMVSETAHFVKDVMGPKGSVSILGGEGSSSADVGGHTRTSRVKVCRVGCADEVLDMDDEPDHDELCAREQRYLYEAISGDWDLGEHMEDAVRSLGIVLAADLSMREKRAVDL